MLVVIVARPDQWTQPHAVTSNKKQILRSVQGRGREGDPATIRGDDGFGEAAGMVRGHVGQGRLDTDARLGAQIAQIAAKAGDGAIRSDDTPALGPATCHGAAPVGQDCSLSLPTPKSHRTERHGGSPHLAGDRQRPARDYRRYRSARVNGSPLSPSGPVFASSD